MRDRTHKILAALLLVIFAAFVGGNTLCVHSHVGPQGMVTHSHPYLPSGHHSHSAVQFDSLAAINALSFEATVAVQCFLPVVSYYIDLAYDLYDCFLPADTRNMLDRRGPPAFA